LAAAAALKGRPYNEAYHRGRALRLHRRIVLAAADEANVPSTDRPEYPGYPEGGYGYRNGYDPIFRFQVERRKERDRQPEIDWDAIARELALPLVRSPKPPAEDAVPLYPVARDGALYAANSVGPWLARVLVDTVSSSLVVTESLAARLLERGVAHEGPGRDRYPCGRLDTPRPEHPH
jgi:hypothetical protein